MSAPKMSGGVLAAVERQLEALSPRDRRLLFGLVAFMGLVAVGFLWVTLYGSLENEASRVRDAKSKLEQAQILQQDYLTAAAQAEAQEQRLRGYRSRPVKAYVEEVATDKGVIEFIRVLNAQGQPEVVGSVMQTTYALDMQRVPDLEALMRFVHELETGGYPLHVETANVRTTRRRDETTYNLKLDMIVYSLAEG